MSQRHSVDWVGLVGGGVVNEWGLGQHVFGGESFCESFSVSYELLNNFKNGSIVGNSVGGITIQE